MARKPPGRPPAEIDIGQLEKLAQIHCTIAEIAAFFGVSEKTIDNYLNPEKHGPAYREAWERGLLKGKSSLRRLQWQHANQGGTAGVTMTIHLAKHWLGETDRAALALTGADGGPVQHALAGAPVGPDELLAVLEKMAAKRDQAAQATDAKPNGQSGTGNGAAH